MDDNKGLLYVTIGVVAITVIALFGLLFVFAPKPISEDKLQEYLYSDEAYVRGNPNGKVVIVEFADFQCPACQLEHGNFQELLKKYPNDIKFIHRHFPLSFHKNALQGSLAAEAAGAQGKFYEYGDKLYEKQQEWETLDGDALTTKLNDYAKEIGIADLDKFEKDLKDQTYLSKVNADQKEGEGLKVAGTPTVYINNKLIDNPTLVVMDTEIKKILGQN